MHVKHFLELVSSSRSFSPFPAGPCAVWLPASTVTAGLTRPSVWEALKNCALVTGMPVSATGPCTLLICKSHCGIICNSFLPPSFYIFSVCQMKFKNYRYFRWTLTCTISGSNNSFVLQVPLSPQPSPGPPPGKSPHLLIGTHQCSGVRDCRQQPISHPHSALP